MKKIYQDHNNISVQSEVEGHVYGIYAHSKGKDYHNFVGLQRLQFQNGPIKEVGINGIQNEHLLAILINRLLFLDSEFPCPQNKRAITHLQIAMDNLEERTKDRIARSVEVENKL